MAEIADADLDRLGRERTRRDDAGADRTDPPADHGSSLTFHPDLTDDGGLSAREGCSLAGPYNLQHDRIVLACKPLFLSSMIRKSGYRFSEKIMLKTIAPTYCGIATMKMPFIFALAFVIATPAGADPPKVAVFDFELVDTSLQGEVYGARSDEHDRLMRAGDQLRRELADSGKFTVVDVAAVNAAAHGSNLEAYGGAMVARDELSAAQPAAHAELRRAHAAMRPIEKIRPSAVRRASADDRP